jgi:hypothetical protein
VGLGSGGYFVSCVLPKSISSDAEEWGSLFVKCLELDYASLAAELPEGATWPDFQKAMMVAAGMVFDESGGAPEITARLTGPEWPWSTAPGNDARHIRYLR